jgi:nucleotide-binding universal stress UspA family protein
MAKVQANLGAADQRGSEATILAGYDPRARDRAPIDFGVALAELTGARLIVAAVQAGEPVMGVFPGTALPYAVESVDHDLVPDCQEALDEIAPDLRGRGITFECRAIDGLSAARALQQAAEAADVALLVVGAGRLRVFRSTAQRLLHGAPCPVAVVRRKWRPRPLRTIGAAVAGAGADRDVICAAHALARLARAKLRVWTVVRVTAATYARTEPGGAVRPAQDVEREYGALASRDLERSVAALRDVELEIGALAGDPAEKLIELSDQVDVLVCGSRGHGPVLAALLGSVSRVLVAEAHCPLIVLPHGVSGRLDALFAGETVV